MIRDEYLTIFLSQHLIWYFIIHVIVWKKELILNIYIWA